MNSISLKSLVNQGEGLNLECKRSTTGRREGYAKLTVKKIPKAVLARCEWGKDDHSLKVEDLPKAPPKSGQRSLFDEEEP